jgi:large subunit ribosomal protein L4
MQAQLLDVKGKEVGKVDLKENVFGLKPSKEFLHEFVTVFLANQRQNTANTKSKAEVSGSGKKPWKQKHTGRARAGSTRSPLWRHGGIVFGPRYVGPIRFGMPRQKARLALAQALAARQADGGLVFVDAFAASGKTKDAAQALKALGCSDLKTVTVVVDSPDAKLTQAIRNIPGVAVLLAGDLNAYVVLRSRKLIVTKPALEKLAARWN